MRADAILFDKDGTLFNFGATWEAWAQAFVMRAASNDRLRAAGIARVIGYDLDAAAFEPDSIAIAETPADIAAALVPHLPEMSAAEILDMINEEAAIVPQAEAVPLVPFLNGLRESGLRLGVATNDAEIPALAHLGSAGVLDLFDFVAGFDSGHGAKPGPGQLLAFAGRVGADPARVVMVGDSAHDLVAGRNAGMQTAGVLTGLATTGDLAPHADVVLPDIRHLPGWLSGTERRAM